MAKDKKTEIEYLWEDRKRILGMPITFSRYKLSNDRLFFVQGFLNIKDEEIQLYRVRDISLKRNLWQRIFGVGTVTVNSSDRSMPVLEIKNVKNPFKVKEMINEHVEQVKMKRGMRLGEMIDTHVGFTDADNDGIPDDIDPRVDY